MDSNAQEKDIIAKELIERLGEFPQHEEVVFSLEAINGHREHPIYFVADLWEAIMFEDKDLNRIVEYCQKDVLTTVQLMLRYKGEPLIKNENVMYP